MPAELTGAVIPAFFPELSAHIHSVRLSTAGSATAGKLSATSNASPNQRIATAALFYLPDDLNEAYSLPSFQTEAGPLFHKKQIAGVGFGHRHCDRLRHRIPGMTLTAALTPQAFSGPFVDVQ